MGHHLSHLRFEIYYNLSAYDAIAMRISSLICAAYKFFLT